MKEILGLFERVFSAVYNKNVAVNETRFNSHFRIE